jgi:HlyD family secretion protein
VGQTVAASLQAPTLFTIAQDLKKMQVDTNVAEADVGKLQDNMQATFTVDAYPTTQFVGHIRQIRNASQTVQNVVTYDAVIDVENPDLKLRPGMTANITFVYARREDTLMVANAALRFRPPPGFGQPPGSHRSHAPTGGGGETQPHPTSGKDLAPDERTVWVLHGDQPRSMVVKVGLTDGSNTELLTDALEEGDKLITAAPDHAGPGGSGTQNMPMRRLF